MQLNLESQTIVWNKLSDNFKLILDKIIVKAFFGNQIVVRSGLYDSAAIHYDYIVSISDR